MCHAECRKYPLIGQVSAQYVRDYFLPSCGLAHLSGMFYSLRIDGRLLNSIQRKHLDKYLNITRKLHQTSLLTGIELLRRFKFDSKVALLFTHEYLEANNFLKYRRSRHGAAPVSGTMLIC